MVALGLPCQASIAFDQLLLKVGDGGSRTHRKLATPPSGSGATCRRYGFNITKSSSQGRHYKHYFCSVGIYFPSWVGDTVGGGPKSTSLLISFHLSLIIYL